MNAGLCDLCVWSRQVPAANSSFVMCARGLTDRAYPKYPVLPVRACRGFAPLAPPEPPPEDAS